MQNYNKTFNSASSISVGMDVHKKTIAFCVYHAKTGAVLDERELPHDLPKVIKYLQKVQTRHGQLHCCYEASPCGFGLPRMLEANGILCEVIAPSSIPSRSGDRVKTDRRDAQKLATLYVAGLLTPVSIPDEEQEALRSLVRCRGDLSETITQTKQRILAFLQVRGFQYCGRTRWIRSFIRGFVHCPSPEWIRTPCKPICTNWINWSKKYSELKKIYPSRLGKVRMMSR